MTRTWTKPETTNWVRGAVSGDSGDVRILKLTSLDSLDTAVGVEAHLKLREGITTTHAVLEAQVEDEDECTVRVFLGDDPDGWLPSATPGRWDFEIVVEFGNGVSETWPMEQKATIPVRAGVDD